MRDSVESVDEPVDVMLTGGPVDLPDRRRRVPEAEYKIKVPHLGGYEHFERTEELARQEALAGQPDQVRVYRWTMRTQIAE